MNAEKHSSLDVYSTMDYLYLYSVFVNCVQNTKEVSVLKRKLSSRRKTNTETTGQLGFKTGTSINDKT